MKHIASITDVAENHLCTGCGVCSFVQPQEITMVDDLDAGRRPLVVPGADTGAALSVCPGIALEHHRDEWSGAADETLAAAWGPVLEVWEGHAADPEIRYLGSSGGVVSALALHCLESGDAYGVLHTAARPGDAILNETRLSRTREELLAGAGSRYAPASPCDGLDLVLAAPGPCVFVGKPCDVAATAMARRRDPLLDSRLALTIAVFCAGTPSARGTIKLLEAMGLEPEAVNGLRYRGRGWPGRAEASTAEPPSSQIRSLGYKDAWGGLLQRHRQWRCHICPDHTGEFADLSVGDPWYRDIAPGERGASLLVVRSERGRKIVLTAMEAGAVELRRVPSDRLAASQPNLLAARGAVWGRVATMKSLGLPTPRYRGLPTLPFWFSELSLKQKVASVLGTARRVHSRRLRQPRPVRPYRPLATGPSGSSGVERPRFIVITPARDEVLHLNTIASNIEAQTWRPEEWIIVDDGSTDGTGKLADDIAASANWVRVVHRRDRGARLPGRGVVDAFYEGLEATSVEDWDFLVKLDADLEFMPDYFETCLRAMLLRPDLGIVGGRLEDRTKTGSLRRIEHPRFHVRGATKIYRRETWRAIGGLVPAAGWDTIDELRANQLGWRTATLPEAIAVQRRETGARAGVFKDVVKNGRAAHFIGYHPLFILARATRLAFVRPYGLRGIALLNGYFNAVVRRAPQVSDVELRRYIQHQQVRRLMRRSSMWW